MTEKLHHLTRRLTGFDATTVVVSDMVGTGIFFTTGFVLATIDSAHGMLLAWLATGVMALLGALSYAELATMFPQAGGEYNYLREMGRDLLGDRHGPLLGFLSGWTSLFIGFSAPMAISALGFTTYMSHFFPFISPKNIIYEAGFLTISIGSLFSILVIMFFAAIHFLKKGADRYIQVLLTVIKVVALMVLIGVTLYSDKGSIANFSSVIEGSNMGLTAFVAGMVPIWFCYTGWNASAYIASEIKNPEKNLPLSLISGTLFVTVLYLVINIVYVYALPVADLKNVPAVAEKSAIALLGVSGGKLISIVIALSIIGALHTLLLIGPRVLFAMSRDGIFFKFVANVDPATAVPRQSISILAVISSIMILVADLRSLLEYAGFVLVVFSFVAVASVFVFRKSRPNAKRPYKTWGYPFVPALFCIFSIYLMYSSFVYNIMATILGIGVVLLGVPIYYIFFYVKHGKFERLE